MVVSMMAISFLVLVLLGLFVLATLVVGGLVSLLGRNAWPVVALLGAGVMFLLVGAVMFVGLFRLRSTVSTPVTYETARVVAGPAETAIPTRTAEPLPTGDAAAPADRIAAELESAEPSAPSVAPSSEKPKKSNSVLRILAHALLKAIDEEEAAQTNAQHAPAQLAPAKVTPVALEEPLPSADQPAWVGTEPHRKDGVYQVAVVTGPYLTLEECESRLPEELHKAVADYVEIRIGAEASRRVRLPLDYIETHLVKERWEERKEYSVGPMLRLHVLVAFDRQANQRLQEAWDALVVQKRIWVLGTLSTVLLSVLAVTYAYLKTDLATEGNYRGRLRLAAAAAIVLLIVVGLAFMA